MYDAIKDQLNGAVPYAAHSGVSITELAEGTATSVLPASGETLNHIGTVHAGAMFTLAETASGAALAGAIAPELFNVVPVAASASIQYLKKAKGDLHATAHVAEGAGDVLATLRADGKVVFGIDVDILDAAENVVAKVSVDWHVSKRKDA